MTSNHHALYVPGLHSATNGRYRGQRRSDLSESQKSRSQFDCRLQSARMKSESLVIASQHIAVNTFPVLYTPPVTPRKLATPEVDELTARKQSPRGADGGGSRNKVAVSEGAAGSPPSGVTLKSVSYGRYIRQSSVWFQDQSLEKGE